MATTMHPGMTERRHIPDRRIHVASGTTTSASTGSSTSATTDARSSRMSAVDWIAMALLIIGGLNWGLVGLFNFDLVATLFGEGSAVARVIYTLVGLSALYSIYTASKMSRART